MAAFGSKADSGKPSDGVSSRPYVVAACEEFPSCGIIFI
jgi:hypothetical protein